MKVMLDPTLQWVQNLRKEYDFNAKIGNVKIKSSTLLVKITGIVRTGASQTKQGRSEKIKKRRYRNRQKPQPKQTNTQNQKTKTLRKLREKQKEKGEECFWIALENVLASHKSNSNSCLLHFWMVTGAFTTMKAAARKHCNWKSKWMD